MYSYTMSYLPQKCVDIMVLQIALPSLYEMICTSILLHTVNTAWWKAVLHWSAKSYFLVKQIQIGSK